MRPTEFSDDQIIQAGQDLQTEGRNLTGFALRQKVGGGTPQRLKQVWDEYQSSLAATVAEPVAELPVEVAEVVATVSKALTERIAVLAVELNDKAVKAAERKVHEVVRSAGEQRAQAERELADASETVDELEAKLDEAQTRGDTLASKLTSVQEANQAQAVELAQVRERWALTEQHAAELARMNATAEAERARHQLEAEKEAQRATDRITNAEADRDTASQQASTAREDAARLRGQVEAMQTQTASLMLALAVHPATVAEGGSKGNFVPPTPN